MDPGAPEIAKISFSWAPDQTGTLWLIQTASDVLTAEAPFRPRDAESCAWRALKSAFTKDAAARPQHPVVFVVPELSLDADRVPDVIAALQQLPDNRLVVAGLSHLSREQCDDIEPGTGSREDLWIGEWGPNVYANAALVATKREQYIEPKGQPSLVEQQRRCFIRGTRLRVFESADPAAGVVRCAVLICSEFLDDHDPQGFAPRIARANPDLIFWLQHNEKPRSSKFSPRLLPLFETRQPLVVAANVRPPDKARGSFGGSGLLFTDTAILQRDKRQLCRSADYCTEPLEKGYRVARIALPRYDVAAHRIETVLPRDFGLAGNPGAATQRFIGAVQPFLLQDDALTAAPAAAHIQDLIGRGIKTAQANAGLSIAQANAFAPEFRRVEQEFCGANQLLVFLDSALDRLDEATHAHFASHDPASCCSCWDHRLDFDRLFDETKGLPAKVAELAMAIAALGGTLVGAYSPRAYTNVRVADHQLLLALKDGLDAEFERSYFKGDKDPLVSMPAAVVLRAKRLRRVEDVDAARITPLGEVDQAFFGRLEPRRLYGDEFWQAVTDGTVMDRLFG